MRQWVLNVWALQRGCNKCPDMARKTTEIVSIPYEMCTLVLIGGWWITDRIFAKVSPKRKGWFISFYLELISAPKTFWKRGLIVPLRNKLLIKFSEKPCRLEQIGMKATQRHTYKYSITAAIITGFEVFLMFRLRSLSQSCAKIDPNSSLSAPKLLIMIQSSGKNWQSALPFFRLISFKGFEKH